jgi:putative ABC transport system substrate-binding protein
MRRREYITLLGGAAAGWPLAARAQQPAMPVVGFLGRSPPALFGNQVRAFLGGLNELGYVEGRTVAIEWRWAEGQDDRLPAMAADLVARQVAVLATSGGIHPARAAKAATATIPIVFAMGDDPVDVGLVPSLNRPGGNLTGVTSLNVEVGPKRLELLQELVPGISTIALLVNPSNPSPQLLELQTAADKLGLHLRVVHASTERELEPVFSTLAQQRARALVIGMDALFISHSAQLAELSLRHAVPAVFVFRDFAAAGGLMSYGGSFNETYRQLGIYSGRVLNGEKPADLPVVRVTKVELVINLKTAKALGLTVPLPLSGRADELIE